MQVIEAVKQDRGVFSLDRFCDPDTVSLIVDGILVIIVVIHFGPVFVRGDFGFIFFLFYILDPAASITFVDINHFDVTGSRGTLHSHAEPLIIFVIPGSRIIIDLQCVVQRHGCARNITVRVICCFQSLCDIRITLKDSLLVILDVNLFIRALEFSLCQILQSTL